MDAKWVNVNDILHQGLFFLSLIYLDTINFAQTVATHKDSNKIQAKLWDTEYM